jgi:hypothetical protein
MRNWRFWLGLVISAVFLYYTLARLELDKVWATLITANYWWLVPGVLVYFGAVWARTWRWHYLLRSVKPVPLTRLFPVVTIGYMGNNVYPARAGELIRAYVLKRKEGISVSASLATIVVERLFDGVTMLFFVFVALPFTPLPEWLRSTVILSSLAFFGALLAFFAIAASPDRSERLYSRLVARFVPRPLQGRINGYLDRFMTGLHCLRSGKDVAMIFLTSVVIWLTETTKYWFVMHGFAFQVPFYVLMLMTAVVNLATTIPSSPGYVGTFDTPGIETLKAFGVPADIAAGYTFVLHAALWLPITLLGLFYMGRESLTWKEFGVARQAKEQRLEVV